MLLAIVFTTTALKAQPGVTFTNIHNFGSISLGEDPATDLVEGSDGNFYGTAKAGGSNFYGEVFQMTPTGAMTVIYSFTDGVDGANPMASLVLGSDGNFYGTAAQGGIDGWGTVFKLTTGGSLTPLYSFTNGIDGANPVASLVLGRDGDFYGTASFGGTNVYFGTVFKITASGSLTPLHSFTGNDGGFPAAGLAQGSDGNFYGTSEYFGGNDYGTVFKITPSGSFTSLYSFTGGDDGGSPVAALALGSDGNFYGTSSLGGTSDLGTVFKISAGGSLTSLYSFVDGAYPQDALVQGTDGNFYGTTQFGGAVSNGTAFKISAGGSFTSLYSFTNGIDGAEPVAGLALGSDGNFYGAALYGGSNRMGTLFKMSASGLLTPLYSFTNGNGGLFPLATLLLGSDGNFYGTTENGGGAPGIGDGTVFKMAPNGLFTPLYSFTNGDDGSVPLGGLAQGDDGNFYGTTKLGGRRGSGTVFKISSGGTFTPVYSFTNGTDGGNPLDTLALGSDGNFYGTTQAGGVGVGGTVFSITTAGSLKTLYAFTNNNNGGEFPDAGLALGSDGNFYGTTYAGGSNGYGTVFKITAGASFTPLYSFTNGIDGANPEASLVQGSDVNFYGTTIDGGTSGDGAIFKITPSGSLTPLYSFTNGADGAYPEAALVQGTDGNFYGTTFAGGGPADAGVVFQITPRGSLTPLFAFNEIDGGIPRAGLVQGPDGSFYGESGDYGVGGNGTIFRISVGTATSSATVSIITNNVFGFSNGQFGFDITGPSTSTVVIQASTNLQTWIPVETNLLGATPLYFSDPQSRATPLRFYRAVLP